jgi:hypothetical protein
MDGVMIDRQGNVNADDVTIMRSLDELPAIVRNGSTVGSTAGFPKPSTTTTSAR